MNYKILILKNVSDFILKTLKKGPYVHKRIIKSKPKTLLVFFSNVINLQPCSFASH